MNAKLKQLIFIFIIFNIFFVNFCQAQLLKDPGLIHRMVIPMKDKAGFGDAELAGIVATVISTFLGLLAVIFIILMIIAGYSWMTAAGNEDKVSKAKDTIKRAIIGLIIIIAAYSITYFVFRNLPGG